MSLVQGTPCNQTNGVTNRGNSVTFSKERRLAFTLLRLLLQGLTVQAKAGLPEFLDVIHLNSFLLYAAVV